jgi:3',5'-cyclic AMP phosphodiesterase CpdA
MRRVMVTALAAALVATVDAQQLTLPNKPDSVRFAIIGDSGTGGSAQEKVAQQLIAFHKVFPFELALMMGDNLYGGEEAADFVDKFERPYKPLLDAGVKFHAALGNHDDPSQRFYKPFNMNGERFYTFKAPKGSIRFYALDSNYMEKEQLEWLKKELPASDSDWKIAFFHHPLYSSGEKHGADVPLRETLEPLFVEHGISVVFTGHEHFYERLKPQKGITYFISGSSAKLRKNNIASSDMSAKGFDQGYTFMLIEINKDDMFFQTIDERGRSVDSGVVHRRTAKAPTR